MPLIAGFPGISETRRLETLGKLARHGSIRVRSAVMDEVSAMELQDRRRILAVLAELGDDVGHEAAEVLESLEG